MQTYLYEGRNKLGERMNGRIESANPQAVAKWLMESEISPIRIRELPKPAEQPEWFTNLTGENKVTRVDILHDCGRSLNPAVDAGQIEGGFIQGMGWLTTEELVFDEKGALRTHAPSTYKIPAAGDRPDAFNLAIWRPGENREATIHRSKAVGEPPLMLAISVFSALTDAVASAADQKAMPNLDAPATPERILMAIEDVRRRADHE